jgi:hypothetical protein
MHAEAEAAMTRNHNDWLPGLLAAIGSFIEASFFIKYDLWGGAGEIILSPFVWDATAILLIGQPR